MLENPLQRMKLQHYSYNYKHVILATNSFYCRVSARRWRWCSYRVTQTSSNPWLPWWRLSKWFGHRMENNRKTGICDRHQIHFIWHSKSIWLCLCGYVQRWCPSSLLLPVLAEEAIFSVTSVFVSVSLHSAGWTVGPSDLKEPRATLACLYRGSGRFDMLQLHELNSVDSGHFTQLELSLGWSDLHEIKNVSFCISIQKWICQFC